MPDISKLPELCKILQISFEELVGEKNQETKIAERLMTEKAEEVTLEEMAQVGPLVQPEKLEQKVNEAIEMKGTISFSTLIGLAPFMDKETLGKMAEEIADIDIGKLCAVAPFLAKSTIQKIVNYMMESGQSDRLVAIDPFMGGEMFPKEWKDVSFDKEIEIGNVKIEYRRCEGDDSDEDEDCDGTELDDMDSDEVRELAMKALELGKDTEEYLDYMDEDDIKMLLRKALRK